MRVRSGKCGYAIWRLSMKVSIVSILICSIGTVCFAVRPQAQVPRDERTIIQGSTEAIEGSPVVLSDARYELVGSESTPGQTKVVGHVKVENVSGRPIRVLMLRFAYKLGLRMNFTAMAAVPALGPGESRD